MGKFSRGDYFVIFLVVMVIVFGLIAIGENIYKNTVEIWGI